MRPIVLRIVFLFLASTLVGAAQQSAPAASAPAPQTPRPRKTSTPEQLAFRAAQTEYDAKLATLRTAALAAFDAEAARQKAAPCPNAVTTYDQNMCLAHEVDLTEVNHNKFTTALRAMLALPEPRQPGVPYPLSGPSGPAATPETSTAAFDKSAVAWNAYAKAECDAVDTEWRSGTIVNAMVLTCELRLLRDHLHELDTAYYTLHPD